MLPLTIHPSKICKKIAVFLAHTFPWKFLTSAKKDWDCQLPQLVRAYSTRMFLMWKVLPRVLIWEISWQSTIWTCLEKSLPKWEILGLSPKLFSLRHLPISPMMKHQTTTPWPYHRLQRQTCPPSSLYWLWSRCKSALITKFMPSFLARTSIVEFCRSRNKQPQQKALPCSK